MNRVRKHIVLFLFKLFLSLGLSVNQLHALQYVMNMASVIVTVVFIFYPYHVQSCGILAIQCNWIKVVRTSNMFKDTIFQPGTVALECAVRNPQMLHRRLAYFTWFVFCVESVGLSSVSFRPVCVQLDNTTNPIQRKIKNQIVVFLYKYLSCALKVCQRIIFATSQKAQQTM